MLAQGIIIACYWFVPAVICTYMCTFKLDPFIKVGICTSLAAIICYCSNYVIDMILLGTTGNYYNIDFSNWEHYANGNTNFLIFAGLLLIGIVLIGTGYFRSRKR